jgi:hypothetical protein
VLLEDALEAALEAVPHVPLEPLLGDQALLKR